MRAAVVDIGSNSTRLLIADADRGSGVHELVRRSQVTRLGDGLDESGSLSQRAIDRVLDTLADYRREIDAHAVGANLAVLTAAVREASNGDEFAAAVRDRFGLDAHVLSGEEEAQLTFLGAMWDQRDAVAETVLVDIGGGSTEFVLGHGCEAGFHASLPVGVVRMSERHIRSDPPAREELERLAQDVRSAFEAGLPRAERSAAERGIAVAGTATSAAAMDQQLDPYDPERVHAYPLALATIESLLSRVAAMREGQRRAVSGLHPDRAPTIVAGLVILREAVRAFGLDRVTVSEHDILTGGALRLAGVA